MLNSGLARNKPETIDLADDFELSSGIKPINSIYRVAHIHPRDKFLPFENMLPKKTGINFAYSPLVACEIILQTLLLFNSMQTDIYDKTIKTANELGLDIIEKILYLRRLSISILFNKTPSNNALAIEKAIDDIYKQISYDISKTAMEFIFFKMLFGDMNNTATFVEAKKIAMTFGFENIAHIIQLKQETVITAKALNNIKASLLPQFQALKNTTQYSVSTGVPHAKRPF